ncbi:hypothetical protein [Streptomyces sp. NPDC058701]|uniref:SCO4225 family membrane protein n=1 Tax=Streptomyces sp. NPDC058701 TaxID=3346608 RepID=UPI0036674A39
MVRRWSKPEMWVPGGYLALVAAMLVRLEMASQAGHDTIFSTLGPILATAPVSLLLLTAFGAAKAALESAEVPPPTAEPSYGSLPPAEPLTESVPEPGRYPADWVPDPSVAAEPDLWAGLGIYAPLLIGALINATAIWALLRHLAKGREARSALV